MHAQSRYSRKHLVPAMVAAAIAAIGLAGFLFMHFGPKKDLQDSGISMRTTAVVEEAGATLIPTGPRFEPLTKETSAAPQTATE